MKPKVSDPLFYELQDSFSILVRLGYEPDVTVFIIPGGCTDTLSAMCDLRKAVRFDDRIDQVTMIAYVDARNRRFMSWSVVGQEDTDQWLDQVHQEFFPLVGRVPQAVDK